MVRIGRTRRVTAKDLGSVGKTLNTFKEPKCELHECPACHEKFNICTEEGAKKYDEHLQSELIVDKTRRRAHGWE